MKPCVYLLRVVSLFPPSLWSSCTQALSTFKVKWSESSSSQCQSLKLENLIWSLELSFLWEKLYDTIIFHLWVTHLVGIGFDYITEASPSPPPSHCGFFFDCEHRVSFLVCPVFLLMVLQLVIILWLSWEAVSSSPSTLTFFSGIERLFLIWILAASPQHKLVIIP